ncbi:TPA: hypothetical protein L4S01_003460 [Pseudomonas aeruginosa]|nr:hypothetical protein [Pseudomonas aeruginosa]
MLALYFITKIGDGDTFPWMSAIENQFVSIPETMGIEIAQLHDDGKRIGQGIWITLSGSGVASLLRIKAYPSPLMMFPGVDWSPFVLSMATVMTPPDSMRLMIS